MTSNPDTSRAPFLSAAAAPVADLLAGSTDLRAFLSTAGALTLPERQLIVDQAILLLDQNYVHLPLKMAMHAVNPVQRLRLLRHRLERQTEATMEPEWRFHAEMSEIFHSVRDLHTNYLLPAPFNGKIAYLPFLIEAFEETNGTHYIVSHIMQGFSALGFGPGAEIRYWSGIPIDRAVEINADRFAGSNVPARRSRGLESLTIRPLIIHLPPNEQWVTIGYVGVDGVERELRQDWLVVDNLPPIATDTVSADAATLGLDLEGDEVNRAKRLLFAPQSLAAEQVVQAAGGAPAPAAGAPEVPTSMPGVFRARRVVTPSGTFGHLRIFTFGVNDPAAFVHEFVRLLRLLPQQGLILDVRGNGGGHIFASEFTLQTLTPRRIQPEPVQFINTTLNRQLCRKHQDNPVGIDLGPWFASMDQATATGATFSNAFPITPQDGANAIGQQYHGPVVLITDARCYSATDIFATGFQDHGIGVVLGVDDNTGAGGANVWTHDLLRQLLDLPTPEPNSPYQPLPKGAGMRVSIRRTLRVGALSGTPVEDLGVVPDQRHRMTRNDVLNGNIDLLARAGSLLAQMPRRQLEASATLDAAGTLAIAMQAAHITRVDVFVDGRPRASADLAGPTANVTVSGVPGAKVVRLEGYESGELVAVRTVTL